MGCGLAHASLFIDRRRKKYSSYIGTYSGPNKSLIQGRNKHLIQGQNKAFSGPKKRLIQGRNKHIIQGQSKSFMCIVDKWYRVRVRVRVGGRARFVSKFLVWP